MVKKLLAAFVLIAVLCLSACQGGEGFYFPLKEQVTMSQAYASSEISFPDTLWKASQLTEDLSEILGDDAQLSVADTRIRPVLYEGAPYNGHATKIFAYVGLPDSASAKSPVPAVVLVHGGEGTAFWDWVSMWLDKGFAAIAMDTEGRIPVIGSEMANGFRAPLPDTMAGPSNSGYYADAASPVSQQWMFHAVASVIAANSCLRSLPEIDAGSVGCVGVSWGGVICSIANCYDDRFAFAVPIYGALGMSDTPCNFGSIYAANPRAAALWDTTEQLKTCKTPFLFVNGGSDYHFNVQGTFKSARAAVHSRVLIKKTLDHSQYSASCVKETFEFAERVVRRDTPFYAIKEEPSKERPNLILEGPLKWNPSKIEILYTDHENAVNWQSKRVDTTKNIAAEVPETAKYFFVNVTDPHNFTFSTNICAINE